MIKRINKILAVSKIFDEDAIDFLGEEKCCYFIIFYKACIV